MSKSIATKQKISMMYGRMMAPVAAVLVLAGCGSTPNSSPGSSPEAPFAAADLVGGWSSDCIDPGNGQAFRLVFDLQEAAWAVDYEAYADATCATKNLTVHINGTYELGKASAVDGAREGNFGFAAKTVTPHSAGAAAFLSQACGRDGFVADTATDIAGGCAGLGAYPIADCSVDHDIVSLKDEVLHFGQRPADNNMCTPEKRPTALGAPLHRT